MSSFSDHHAPTATAPPREENANILTRVLRFFFIANHASMGSPAATTYAAFSARKSKNVDKRERYDESVNVITPEYGKSLRRFKMYSRYHHRFKSRKCSRHQSLFSQNSENDCKDCTRESTIKVPLQFICNTTPTMAPAKSSASNIKGGKTYSCQMTKDQITLQEKIKQDDTPVDCVQIKVGRQSSKSLNIESNINEGSRIRTPSPELLRENSKLIEKLNLDYSRKATFLTEQSKLNTQLEKGGGSTSESSESYHISHIHRCLENPSQDSKVRGNAEIPRNDSFPAQDKLFIHSQRCGIPSVEHYQDELYDPAIIAEQHHIMNQIIAGLNQRTKQSVTKGLWEFKGSREREELCNSEKHGMNTKSAVNPRSRSKACSFDDSVIIEQQNRILQQIMSELSFKSDGHDGEKNMRFSKSMSYLVNTDVNSKFYPSDVATAIKGMSKNECKEPTAKRDYSYPKVWNAKDVDFESTFKKKNSKSSPVHSLISPTISSNSLKNRNRRSSQDIHLPSNFRERMITTHSPVTNQDDLRREGSHHACYDDCLKTSEQNPNMGKSHKILRKDHPTESEWLKSSNLKGGEDTSTILCNKEIKTLNDERWIVDRSERGEILRDKNHSPKIKTVNPREPESKHKERNKTSEGKYGETLKCGKRSLSVKSIASTSYEIQQGRAILIQCPCCFCVLQVAAQAKLVICVKCETISPIQKTINQSDDLRIAEAIHYEEIFNSSKKDHDSVIHKSW
jgi:hypothetical protein